MNSYPRINCHNRLVRIRINCHSFGQISELTVTLPIALTYSFYTCSKLSGKCGKLISLLNLLWEKRKTAHEVKNYFNLIADGLMTEKILDFVLARFPTLLIEGLREDIGKKPKVRAISLLKARGKQLVLGPNPRSSPGPTSLIFRTESVL